MAKKIDAEQRRARSLSAIDAALQRYAKLRSGGTHYLFLRWVAAMTVVELHGVWERYAESRLSTALNHHAAHFLAENDIKGVKQVSSGFAAYIVRGGGKFFDFRSMDDLIKRANGLLGVAHNPFGALSKLDRDYLDALAAIRNCVVHGSEQAQTSYRKKLRALYGIKSAPAPDEFLHAIDYRSSSPARYKSRLQGLAAVIDKAIQQTS